MKISNQTKDFVESLAVTIIMPLTMTAVMYGITQGVRMLKHRINFEERIARNDNDRAKNDQWVWTLLGTSFMITWLIIFHVIGFGQKL
jgi:hypothetical protein